MDSQSARQKKVRVSQPKRGNYLYHLISKEIFKYPIFGGTFERPEKYNLDPLAPSKAEAWSRREDWDKAVAVTPGMASALQSG